MSALFNLKTLGSAALALGISAVSLWPEMASANVVFDFSGTCNTAGCPDLTSTATGVLTLTDAYVYGTDISGADFVSFSYSSSDQTFDITSSDSPFLTGGLNSDGSFNASRGFSVQAGLRLFTSYQTGTAPSPRVFLASQDAHSGQDVGSIFTFTNVTPPPAVPEPSTWAMMLIGFAGLGYASRRASRKSAAVAA
jgi:PEP-CTERM motif